ncbi:MAG: T9SS type A sorting domain-containing protein [Calditrichota bacterium]
MKPFFLILLITTTAFALPAPFHFEPNQGQWEGEFAYRCDVGNASYFLTSTGMTIAVTAKDEGRRMRDEEEMPEPQDSMQTIRGHAVMVRLVGASPNFELVPEDKLSSYSNYFKGSDQSQWKSRVPNYGTVVAKEVWPGIDVEYKADPRGVETLFHVKPGADVSQIVVQYYGLDAPLRMDDQGNLVLVTSVGNLYEQAPFAYQIENRMQANIPVRYRLLGDKRYRLVCEEYNRTVELVIDPLVYSTFIAGSFRDEVHDMAMDDSHNKILGGYAGRPGFPTTPGAFQEDIGFGGFVMKFTPNADSLIFSTYISGGGSLWGNIRVAPDSTILFVEQAYLNWPTTPEAYDTSYNGEDEIGIVHLSADGSQLLYGTYLGSSGDDFVRDCEVDSLGQLYIFGETHESDFPITPNALYGNFAEYRCLFVSIINPLGNLSYSTFYAPVFEGSRFAHDLAIAEPGRIWIAVSDYYGRGGMPTTPDALVSETTGRRAGYFARLNLNAGVIEYASYLGAPHDGYEEEFIRKIVLTGSNRLLILGWTSNPTFPMPSGGYNPEPPTGTELDGYILELQLPNTLLRGTFFGGSSSDQPQQLAIEASGDFIIAGNTYSPDLPMTPDAFDSTYFAGPDQYSDIFLCRLSHDLTTLEYSTYIGGEEEDYPVSIAYDSPNAIWLAGQTLSYLFPITSEAMFGQPSGGFLLRMDLSHQSVNDPFIPHPSSFALSSFPNPFNPTATLSFTLPHSAPVTIGIYNVLGQTVYEENLGRLNAGEHQYQFDASELPSGVYLARVQAGELSQMRKIVLLR